ncbi:hypothetical protein QJS10_CPA10g00396 [Acorus calamus]|uniref:Uncharacterized protein n=1 Tax=Acorus calamus TaxID=4465 RepID=A0AAV9DZV1_ACOCL|nr:hypothetical protein QJS10_CPA10g00396 [Acorus calamus]
MSACKHWHTCAVSRPPRPGHRHPPWFLSMHVRSPARSCRAYNPSVDRWLSIPLDFTARPVRLILCKFGSGPLARLALCNPFTRQFDELPDSVCSRRNPAFAIVMGVDEKLEVYVAGGIPEPNSPRMGQVLIEPTMEMYSQRAGGWRVIGSIPGHFATLLTVWTFGEGVHVGGTVYWVTSARAYTIVAYEIGPRAWREVKVPEAERLLYLVTTRNEAVYEITEAEKVEICKGDIKEISKAILLYHSFLSDDELPRAGERLLERCGHHPLTVAVMGKALRKETREEKWEKAISNLSTYASCAPGPVSYVNEKESENTLTIFGSFEFSLEAMDEHPRKFFISLASLSWAEPVPEPCLEALWSALGQESIFPLVACKLVEGSLLMKIDSGFMYQVHDMVSLYLDSKVNEAMQILLVDSVTNGAASVAPWLSIFGKESVKRVSDEKIESFLNAVQETEAVAVLESSIQALMASNSISEFEMSRKSFSTTLGPRIADFISEGSPSLIASSTKAITHLFSNDDYLVYFPSLETMVEKLLCILNSFNDPQILTNASTVVSKLAELSNQDTSDRVLQAVPFDRLSELLAPDTEEWHEGVFATLMSLTKVGKDRAVERIVASGLDERLVELLETGSDVAQHNVIIVLKTLYEAGGLLRPGMLKLLPWHARHNLERFVPVDRNALTSPKLKPFNEILHALIDGGDDKRVLEAMQDLLPMIERVRDPRMRDMILQSPLIERLAGLLRSDNAERTRVESAFVLMKLACMGGERCVREMIERDVVPRLVSMMMMMQTETTELQDAAYAALHQMVFGDGGRLVSDEVAVTRNAWVVERLARALESKSTKAREVAAQFVVDLVEAGSKACVDRVLASRAVEGLARLERGAAEGAVVGVIKGLEKCKSLSKAERRVMKQAVVRRVRAAVRGQRNEGCVLGAVENCLAEGSREGSSGKHRK